MPARRDVVIVGGGHNALVAAAYIASAGHSVVVLERLGHLGGAAVSARPWPGVDARLSRYSYLVSLLPARIIADLGLGIELRRRRYSSYTPDPAHPSRGVLVDTADSAATAASFERAVGDRAEAARFARFSERLAPLARTVFPSLLEPLVPRDELRERLGDDRLWRQVVEEPLGAVIRESLTSDLARGIALTDGLIGTFASADDASLRQNRCFLYHVIGGGTGDWDVPVGGMGRVSSELERAARAAGAELRTHAEVVAVTPDGEVTLADGERLTGRLVLSGVAPVVLDRLLAAGDAATRGAGPSTGAPIGESTAPEGAQVKVNMLLRRLPRLRDEAVAPAAAFAGTFHVNETFSALDAAHAAATAGRIPEPLPAEIYCHTLTDPSILGPQLRVSGAHTLTLFGLQVPHRLVVEPSGTVHESARDDLLAAAIRSVDAVLGEPLTDVLHTTPEGEPCIEARTTADLEDSLGLPGGDIFHGALSWPWAETGDQLDNPAARWGVETRNPGILMCGSGARRGGAVSGIGGHNAARAAMELLRR